MLIRDEFHKTNKSYTATDKIIDLNSGDVPDAKKGMVPHWAAIRIQFSDLDLDNAATIKDLWTDVICKVFHTLNLSMKNNKYLIESCDGNVLQLMKDLYMKNQSWRIAIAVANGIKYYPEIIIPLAYTFDTAEFLHACDLFYSMKFEYDVAKATAGITINTFDFDVNFDLLWYNKRFTSPVRKWQKKEGADNGCVLPNNGRHQFVTLMRDAGTDANLWADGFSVKGLPNNWDVNSSLPLQMAWGNDMWPGGADTESDFGGHYKDHYCPIVYSKKLKPGDGVSAAIQIIRKKNTDPVPYMYALTVIG